MLPDPSSLSATHALPPEIQVRKLQQQLPGVWGANQLSASAGPEAEPSPQPRRSLRVSSGWPALDALLPDQGFLRGSLVEWLSEGPGSGAGSLALRVALQASRPIDSQVLAQVAPIVVLDRGGDFYPPAAVAWGLDLRQLIWLRPQDEGSALWALDQVLRCQAVAAVWARLPRLEGRWFRRFQLAVEQSGCLGLLLRPAHVRGQPSWAQLQLAVRPQPSRFGRRWCIELLRCRGPGRLGEVELQLDELSDRRPALIDGGVVNEPGRPMGSRIPAKARDFLGGP